jgi:Zn-dependent M28 family amino/carboxypeptidase
MRVLSALLLVAASCGGDPKTTPALDPITLAPLVSQAELTASISELEALGTRYTIGQGDERARDYLVGRLTAMGLTAELDPFPAVGETANNIIVKHPGTDEPGVVYIFSAHYDSTSNSAATSAPGADDNASGVAAVLEAARLMTKHTFKYSVWFVFTAAEEQGSLGSKHMVRWLKQQQIDVRGVIAPDMIGYWPDGEDARLEILGDNASAMMVEHMANVAEQLGVGFKKFIDHSFCYGDDHTSFQEGGFPAIAPMDCVEAHNIPDSGHDTPHYHRTSDTMATLHMGMTTKVASVLVVTLAELAEPVAPPAK